MLTIEPRASIGVPSPAGRKLLRRGLRLVLVHHTGVPPVHALEPLQWALMVARYGRGAGKTYEYNYLIGTDGTIWEQAGEYVGAHCLRINALSEGVLIQDVEGAAGGLSPAAGLSFRRLIASQRCGLLACTAEIVPHYRFRATQCPGALASPPGAEWASPTREGRLGDVLEELSGPYVEQAST